MGNGPIIKLRTPLQNIIRYKILPGKLIEQSLIPTHGLPRWYNRYHWNREELFLEGWYHKVVVNDPDTGIPTTFFFLVGINNPSGKGPPGHAKSFVICGNAGSNDGTHFNPPGRLFEKYIPVTQQSAFWADTNTFGIPKGRGMYVYVNTPKSNSVYAHCNENLLEGKVIHDKDNWIIWKILVGKRGGHLFPYPLEKMPSWTGMNAYYNCAKMWADFTGEIHIKENGNYKKFSFSNARGYQDHNWGEKGFPHPWIWIAANRFRQGESLSGKIIPEMALVFIWGTPSVVGPDPDVASLKIIRPNNSIIELKCLPAVTKLGERFLFNVRDTDHYAKTTTVITTGDFGLAHCTGGVLNPKKRVEDKSTSAVLVHMISPKGDDITFSVVCKDKTLMHLPAPKNAMMVPCLAAESLQGILQLRINGKKFISDFSAIESDLNAPISKIYMNNWF